MDRIKTLIIFIFCATVVHGLANPAHSVFIKRALPLSPHGPSDPNSSEEELDAPAVVPAAASPSLQSLPLKPISSEISPTSTTADGELEPTTADTKKRQVSYFPPIRADNDNDDGDVILDDHFPSIRLRKPYPSNCKGGDCPVIKKVPLPFKKHHLPKHSEPCNYILVEKRMYSCEPDDAVMQLLKKSDGTVVGSLSPDGRIGLDPTRFEDS